MTLEKYARDCASHLVDRLATEIKRAANEHDAEAIHDLRVAIRRLTQALRAFRTLLGKEPVKEVRTDLRQLMDLASEVRSRDIALELFARAGVATDTPVCVAVVKERAVYQRRIAAKVKGWARRKVWDSWREQLQLAAVAHEA